MPHLSVSREQRGERHGRVNHLATTRTQQICCAFFLLLFRVCVDYYLTTTSVSVWGDLSCFAHFLFYLVLLFWLFSSFFGFLGKRWRKTRSAVFSRLHDADEFSTRFFLVVNVRWIGLSDDSRSKGGRRGETRCRVLISPCLMYKRRKIRQTLYCVTSKTWLPIRHTHTYLHIIMISWLVYQRAKIYSRDNVVWFSLGILFFLNSSRTNRYEEDERTNVKKERTV